MKVVTLKNDVAPRSRENKRNQSIRILRASMVQYVRRMHDVLVCEDRRQPDFAVGRSRTADRAATFGRYRGTFDRQQAGRREIATRSRNDLAKPGTVFLYPFRARGPLTSKWYRARYKAERHEIAAGYAEWEITG